MDKLADLCEYLKEHKYYEEAEFLLKYIKKAGLSFDIIKEAKKYQIKSGDTPYTLSKGNYQYQKAIENANKQIKDWSKIQIDQVIELPPIAKSENPNNDVVYTIKAIALIKKVETEVLYTYPDFGYRAYGYGHRYGKMDAGEITRYKQTLTKRNKIGTSGFLTARECKFIFGKNFKQIDSGTANKLLLQDINIALGCIKRNIKHKLNQNQVDALISIIYNTGCGTFAQSSLLDTINAGKLNTAAKLIPTSFILSETHKERRKFEAELFRTELI